MEYSNHQMLRAVPSPYGQVGLRLIKRSPEEVPLWSGLWHDPPHVLNAVQQRALALIEIGQTPIVFFQNDSSADRTWSRQRSSFRPSSLRPTFRSCPPRSPPRCHLAEQRVV